MTQSTAPFRTILGIRFYVGDLPGLLERSRQAGLIVVPSAPVLAELPTSAPHREALERSDLAITDSGFLVLLWLLRKGKRLERISGLRYLRALVDWPEFQAPEATFWVMPSAPDAEANLAWLNAHGFQLTSADTYLAPRYPTGRLADPALLATLETRKPAFIVMCVGGGVQERLGHSLRDSLSYRPTILCTGAAIAFLSGRQANIPPWADRFVLGWLFRTLQAPRAFIPRYWKALRLTWILFRYGEKPVR